MKVAMFSGSGNTSPRLGFVLPDGRLVDPLAAWDGLPTRSRPHWGLPVPFAEVFSDSLRFIEAGEPAVSAARTLISAAEQAGVGLLAPEAVRLHAPLARPGKIICAGRNYGAHLAESQQSWQERGRLVERTPFPTGFLKTASTIAGPDAEIVCPRHTRQFDYEVELAVVIGRTAKDVSAAEALDYVAGYTIADDLSARDWQFAEQDQRLSNLVGKNFEGSCPLGPWIVWHDEIPDPGDLKLELRVNGELRQSASTRQLLFTVPELIAHWSMIRLDPGDIILTGTPSGVAFARKPDPTPFWLKPGDVLEHWIEGIGTLRNRIVADPGRSEPRFP